MVTMINYFVSQNPIALVESEKIPPLNQIIYTCNLVLRALGGTQVRINIIHDTLSIFTD